VKNALAIVANSIYGSKAINNVVAHIAVITRKA
jgi:hypothetical protein